ncbi:kinase-like domain-containing protein [Pisolithus albus]|nr:kinase-like domain-containing protein [Pisolithus albus]
MSLYQNQGTLTPGQTISVNKYTVQVEKYLSQGGFSHVYLVRTPAPIYNTTHHVLKRIAVANETMLAEVKKEVDIMRILKGHPNVVYLIDAAWHRMSNGQYEVFILMEFCQGGGIIDMMNRRLRERLTEAEILQIFVDVCEGVAAMHNLRPPLLHRDLKVENILQSSSTTFKLCDFGSATPVAPKPPATTQEIRILEADLNRHTTLQYRAPEMIDPYLRRPVDEKSDVWALGVLLYKLCYYTTPFEEHGPLAILNVQYRIPPYPVYSPQLNALIASMLREHGTQRPSVFELLEQLHLMRGTKSKFVYHIPPRQPLSPRVLQAHPTTTRDHSTASIRPRSSNAQPTQKDVIPGVQVREKVLGNVAPRRGRPSHQKESLLPSTSRPASPTAGSPSTPLKVAKRDWLADDEDKAWKALKSGTPSTGIPDLRDPVMPSAPSSSLTGEPSIPKHTGPGSRALTTFGDNFTEKLRYDSVATGSAGDAPTAPKVKSTSSTLASHLEGSRSTRLVIPKSKDAFDGLGLPAPTLQPPTLGQARKLRTGLAAVGDYNHRVSVSPSPSAVPMIPSSPVSKPAASPRPPLPRTSSSRKSSPSVQPTPLIAARLSESFQPNTTPVEARFPPLEQLDSALASVNPSGLGSLAELSARENKIDLSEPPSLSRLLQPERLGKVRNAKVSQSRSHVALDGVIDASLHTRPNRLGPSPSPSHEKHTASVPPKTGQSSGLLDAVGTSAPTLSEVQNGQESRDWLTGDVDSQLSAVKGLQIPSTSTPDTPVLREFTKKRSSFIEENNVHIPSPQEGITGQQTLPKSPTLQLPTKMLPYPRPEGSHPVGRTLVPEGKKVTRVYSHSYASGFDNTVGRGQGSTLEPIRLSSERVVDSWQYPFPESAHEAKSSSDEEGPEEAVGVIPGRPTEKGSERKRRGRQSSVHDLVDLWGGGVVQTRERVKDATQDSVVRDPSNDPPCIHRGLAP